MWFTSWSRKKLHLTCFTHSHMHRDTAALEDQSYPPIMPFLLSREEGVFVSDSAQTHIKPCHSVSQSDYHQYYIHLSVDMSNPTERCVCTKPKNTHTLLHRHMSKLTFLPWTNTQKNRDQNKQYTSHSSSRVPSLIPTWATFNTTLYCFKGYVLCTLTLYLTLQVIYGSGETVIHDLNLLK